MAPLREIIGHEQPLRVLQGALAARRMHHSLLFFGPDAIGKRRVATALAAALNCVAPREADACGECASCRRIEKGSHPDVTLVTLEKTMIPIDAIRRVRQEASYFPYEGQRRVFIVDIVHGVLPVAEDLHHASTITRQASNAARQAAPW